MIFQKEEAVSALYNTPQHNFSVVVGEEKKKEMIAVHLTFSNSVEECNFAFFRFKKDEEEAAREL